MDILAKLNSGALHAAARNRRPDCVDARGNLHTSPERAAYVNWRNAMAREYGSEPAEWPPEIQRELERRYVKG